MLESDLADQELALREADASDVDVFAPRGFAGARGRLSDARQALARTRAERARMYLREATERLAAAVRHAAEVRRTIAPLVDARARALAVDAHVRDERAWLDAQSAFDEFIRRAESAGAANPSDAAFGRALALFDEAELRAIKVSLLATVDALLERSHVDGVGSLAPVTLADAIGLRNRAERALMRDRVNRDDARRLAELALEQTRHARTLASMVAHVERGETGAMEALLLELERQVQGVAQALEVEYVRSNGLAHMFDRMLSRARAIAAERESMRRELASHERAMVDQARSIAALRARGEELEARIAELESGSTATGVVRAQARVTGAATRDDTSVQVAATSTVQAPPDASEVGDPLVWLASHFSPDEARVHAAGEDIVVALVGLEFAKDHRMLDATSLPLLRKLRTMLARWPTVAIHLFSYRPGEDAASRAISEARAAALGDYLRANAGVDEARLSVFYALDPAASSGDSMPRNLDLVLKSALSR